MGEKYINCRRERVSTATYHAARYRLLHTALSYRQWTRSDPTKAAFWKAHLKKTQRQLLSLWHAERIPVPEATPF